MAVENREKKETQPTPPKKEEGSLVSGERSKYDKFPKLSQEEFDALARR